MRLGQFLPLLLLLQWGSLYFTAESSCKRGCPLALASYYVWSGVNITFIAQVLGSTENDVLSYNPSVPDKDRVQAFTRVNVPFSCDCINGQFLGHMFQYQVHKAETYTTIANNSYANLTTVNWIAKFNSFPANNVPMNAFINVTVNCSCGDSRVSKKYGLFLTYPLRPEDNLTGLVQTMNTTVDLLRKYNPNVNFNGGKGIVFIPAQDVFFVYDRLGVEKKGKQKYHLPSWWCFELHLPHLLVGRRQRWEVSPSDIKVELYANQFFSSVLAGRSAGVIAGISVAVVALLIMLLVLYFTLMRRKKMKNAILLTARESSRLAGSFSAYAQGDTPNVGMTIDKSLEFSYEELAQATANFSMANKIGSGGFGDVYFAELRGEKAAIKKMDMQASKEFLAELNVLTRVHHLNLVRLIGYCVEECLFLVYEYVENGNLSQHLRGSGRDPLPWSTRVQIALDSARGLEYIHEHTVPVYVHRDIKSANILIDKRFHAKVADFGLTKLTEVGVASGPTHLVGTFGYMPPEKIQLYGFLMVMPFVETRRDAPLALLFSLLIDLSCYGYAMLIFSCGEVPYEAGNIELRFFFTCSGIKCVLPSP
ncbi:hypothetical protein Cgig2_008915 [Carnegiea gigantea]|uniref:Protein kinase domain-containing protein n=1 Tax=Carnegiea gigantea TaxID=171969 RepID=A0A9Q1JN05_9CARY|nr:hypothetical protein Cgig2_008915 [Carnegiea gigantea]